MSSERKLQDIVKRTAELISATADPEELTTKRIADNAGINPAMVNYYFGSKDELIKISLTEYIGHRRNADAGVDNPRKIMFDMLLSSYETTALYSRYNLNKDVTGYANENLSLASEIADICIRCKCRNCHIDEIKEDSYKMVSYIRSVALNTEGFQDYSGIDLSEKNSIKMFISEQLGMFLGEEL